MRYGLLTLVCLGLGTAATASAGPLEDQFFQMDTNSSGSVSRAEFVAFSKSNGDTERRANFAFDNFSGVDEKISLNEYRAGPVERTERRAVRAARPVTPPPTRRTPPPRERTRGGSGS